MWNRKWQFKPAEIIGLLALVERDTEQALDFGRPMFWVHAPYDLIPCEILVYESYRLMHTLVTDTQTEAGHNAVEEALLYGLCHALLEPGSEGEFAVEVLQTVNALRRRARQRPVRELSRLEAEDWDQDVLDRVLFWDRDWQLASAATVRAALLQQTEVRERLRIEEDYFDVTYRRPSALELQAARAVFQEILTRARLNRSAKGVGGIAPLHQE